MSKECITTILVVDDEPEIRSLVSRYFEFKGYVVDEAVNGKDALNKMDEKIYQVVISDINMPEMNGIEFLKNGHRENPMTYFIMITGYVTQDNILSCIRYGAETCIFKPLKNMKELDDAVKTAVQKINNWNKKLKTLSSLKE